MSHKNIRRLDDEDAFYHVYNRGVAKMEIFLDEDDYNFFETLLVRCLSPAIIADRFGRQRPNFNGSVQLHTYCLMPNHFHLLFWQKEQRAIGFMMRSVTIGYSMYFNRKYKRSGPVFESRYKSVRVKSDEQLTHVSRYIHLNPVGYRIWDRSSYSDYVYVPRGWVTTDFILSLFPSKKAYLEYVDDYEDVKRMNDKYKREMANL
jgi:putative transposase